MFDITDLLALVRAPDWHWRGEDIADFYHWGVTENPEALSRVALSTTTGGRYPFCLHLDDGACYLDPRAIEAAVQDPAFRRKYGIEREAGDTE